MKNTKELVKLQCFSSIRFSKVLCGYWLPHLLNNGSEPNNK